MLTSTQSNACNTNNSTACAVPMYYNSNVGYNIPSTWTLISCCYSSSTASQLTIEFTIQEDDSGYWLIDDVSATQGTGELITNGGFESNLSNWTVALGVIATANIFVDTVSGQQHSGLGFLSASSASSSSYIQQTFPIVQGTNTLVSFWLLYMPAFGSSFGISEISVTLT